jgi:hypothetical protein
MTHRSSRRLAPAFLLLALLPVSALAAQDLPDADALIATYVEQIGGEELWNVGTTMSGTMSMPAAGLQGTFELFQAPPNRMVMRLNLPGVGEIRTGYDGQVGWSMDPMSGPSLMEGAQLDQTREEASVAASFRDPELVPGRETLEEAEFGGEACWLVQLTWASGRESRDCYSMETGLLVASEGTQASPMGEIRSVTRFEDYREFEGRLLPTRMVQESMGMEQVLEVESVTFGAVDDGEFDLPAAIQTLVGDGSY